MPDERREALPLAASIAEHLDWRNVRANEGRLVARALLASEQENAELREALEKWRAVSPPHRYECNPLRTDGIGCTCGLQEARDHTRRALTPSEPS